jgi:N utilization substance protein B
MMVLYEASIKGLPASKILDDRMANPGAESPLTNLSVEILRGVIENETQIDAVIDHHLRDFRLERLLRLDKALLQIGVWELLFSDVEREVVLEQAKLLAEKYCDAKSVDFVFALLANVQPQDAELPELVPVQSKSDRADYRKIRKSKPSRRPKRSN